MTARHIRRAARTVDAPKPPIYTADPRI